MKIIPATLRDSFEKIEKDISSLGEVTDLISIDICDGIYVPSLTWLPSQENLIEAKSFFDKFENRISFEFDLMVSDTLRYLDLALKLGAKKVVIHTQDREMIEKAIEVVDKFNVTNGFFSSVEIGLSAKDEVLLADFKDDIDYIQIMGIKKIGFQHQIFDEAVVEKIKKVRAFYEGVIQIDGGMNTQNIKKCKEAGADNFVMGSAIFAEGDAVENYK